MAAPGHQPSSQITGRLQGAQDHALTPPIEGVALVDIDTLAVRSWLAPMEREGRVGASTGRRPTGSCRASWPWPWRAATCCATSCTVKGAGIERAPEMAVATVAQVAALAAAVPRAARP